jgi:hypothetical protein
MSRNFNKNTAHVLETDVQKIQKYGSRAGDRCPENSKIRLACWRQMSRELLKRRGRGGVQREFNYISARRHQMLQYRGLLNSSTITTTRLQGSFTGL